MVTVYCLDISGIDKDIYEKFYAAASAERKERADRCGSFFDAARCILAEALLRFCLAQVFGKGFEPVIGTGPHGRPYLKNAPQFSFNLSHSGSFVAAAYSRDGAVGVDVERIRRDVCAEKIAARFFVHKEREYIASADGEEDRASRFARIWTLKESYVKYLGAGLSKRLDSFCVDVPEGRVEDEERERGKGKEQEREQKNGSDSVRFLSRRLGEDYYVSVCFQPYEAQEAFSAIPDPFNVIALNDFPLPQDP